MAIRDPYALVQDDFKRLGRGGLNPIGGQTAWGAPSRPMASPVQQQPNQPVPQPRLPFVNAFQTPGKPLQMGAAQTATQTVQSPTMVTPPVPQRATPIAPAPIPAPAPKVQTPVMVSPPVPQQAQPTVQSPTMVTPTTPTQATATQATTPTVQSPTMVTPAAPKQASAAATPPADTTVTPPGVPTTFEDSLAEFQKTAAGWMAGVDDPIFRQQANRVIEQLGLINQAQTDALRMQIAQDPELRGQGAGVALLAMMARDQNFKIDDVMAQLSEQSAQRVLDMQKYGFDMGLKINTLRRERGIEDADALVAAGDFDGAAAILNKVFNADMPGLGIKVDASTLQSRDPQALKEFESRMGVIARLAKTSPEAAAAAMETLLGDPRFKSWFPEGVSAKDLIASINSDNVIEGIQKADTLGQAINQMAVAGRSYDAAQNAIEAYFSASGRDAVSEGRKLTIAQVNAIRTADKLGEFHEENGELVDDAGLPLDEEDYKDLAYRQEYQTRMTKANEAPWQPLMDVLLKSNLGAKFTDPALFPNGRNALEDYVQSLYLTHSYTTDPETGLMVPNAQAPLPWNDPALYHQFYSWPSAVFEAGKVVGTPDMGGDAYGDTLGDTKVVSTPDDEALDAKWISYQRSGGKLSAREWYFASAGGTLDPARAGASEVIPEGVRTGTGTVTGTTGIPNPTDPNYTIEKTAFESTFNNLKAEELKTKLGGQAFLNQAIGYGMIENVTNPASVGTMDWNQLATESGGYVAINGKPVHIDGNAGVFEGVTYVHLTTSDGKQYVMVVDGATAGLPVGAVFPRGPSGPVFNSGATPGRYVSTPWETAFGGASA